MLLFFLIFSFIFKYSIVSSLHCNFGKNDVLVVKFDQWLGFGNIFRTAEFFFSSAIKSIVLGYYLFWLFFIVLWIKIDHNYVFYPNSILMKGFFEKYKKLRLRKNSELRLCGEHRNGLSLAPWLIIMAVDGRMVF